MSSQSTTQARLKFINLGDNADLVQLISPNGEAVQFSITSNGGIQIVPQVLAASGAIPVAAATYIITKSSIAALTLAAPVTGVDDGIEICLISNTAFAHSISAPLLTGTIAIASVTFPAFAGASVALVAYQGKYVISSLGFGAYVLA